MLMPHEQLDQLGHWYCFTFARKSDQLQFSLSVCHQKYTIQYGEFGNRQSAQMKVD